MVAAPPIAPPSTSRRADVSLGEVFRQTQSWDGRWVPGRLPLSAINVLPQPRKTFEGIEELAEGIAAEGLLQVSTVAEFAPQQCLEYLETLSSLWGVRLDRDDCVAIQTSDGERYYLLIAGERRFRACTRLWFIGCEECQEVGVHEGECFTKHFGDELLPVQIGRSVPPLRALYTQFGENTHMRVPPHEEAPGIAQFYELVRQVEPTMSIAGFARRMSMGASKVRAALIYTRLPDSIKAAVEEHVQFSYGHALELARLQDDGEDEGALHRFATRAVTKGLRVKGFREMINNYLTEKHSGQTGLFDAAFAAQLENSGRRQVLIPHYLAAARTFIDYLSRVESAFEDGGLGRDDSPFSDLSVARAFLRMVEVQKRLLANHLSERLPRSRCEPTAQALGTFSAALEVRVEDLEVYNA